MRVKKNAVRSWLNRNGMLNLELFNLPPTKTSRWQNVHRPRTSRGRVRLFGIILCGFSLQGLKTLVAFRLGLETVALDLVNLGHGFDKTSERKEKRRDNRN